MKGVVSSTKTFAKSAVKSAKIKKRVRVAGKKFMKKILARGGIEFLAVLLGITGSLWIDQNQEIRREKEYQITILESIYNDIIQTEKFFIESRDLAFTADRVWMDYLSNNWDSLIVDSVAVAISKEKHSVFTLYFLILERFIHHFLRLK